MKAATALGTFAVDIAVMRRRDAEMILLQDIVFNNEVAYNF